MLVGGGVGFGFKPLGRPLGPLAPRRAMCKVFLTLVSMDVAAGV